MENIGVSDAKIAAKSCLFRPTTATPISVVPPAQLIADTGCTSHFCTINTPVINTRPTANPIAIQNPNGSVMHSTHEAELDLPALPPAARHVHLVPALSTFSLISMGQLCDSGCKIIFDATTVHVYLKNQCILQGTRSNETRLWHLDSTPVPAKTTLEHANNALSAASPATHVAFAHAALFSPALSTLHTALHRGFLPTFPGLSIKSLRKHPPRSGAMIKGHLDQTRQNKQSTRQTPAKHRYTPTNQHDDSYFPKSDEPNTRSNSSYIDTIHITGQIYTDQTGRFPTPSSTGNNYVMVLYDYDSNAILVEPMRTRTTKSILDAYKNLHARLCTAGQRPTLQRLDNECSHALKTYMTEQNIDFQLVPPGSHRRNAAERAIRTFQNHFIAGLCSLDPDFPLHLWDRLLPQAEMTLNMLRGSRMNPRLSAHVQLHGLFDFNRTPIAPPGIRVLVHEKPNQRTTWSPHALDGWYVGPALNSYGCYNIWIWDTRAERVCDTVSWFPTKVAMPLASTNDLILAGVHDILHAIQNPIPPASLASLSPQHTKALTTLTTILTGIATPDTSEHQVSSQVDPPFITPTTHAPLRVGKSVHFADMPPKHTAVTFTKVTGPLGKRHRKQTRVAITKPPTKTVHPNKLNPPAQHQHNTRSKPYTITQSANLVVNAKANLGQHFALHGNAFNPDTGQLAEYPELSRSSEGSLWQASNAEEIGRLAQGYGTQAGTNTIFFIPHTAVPKGKKPTYLRIVAAFRPEKTNPRRIRWTCGGDKIDYLGDVSTKTADLSTAKILFNSVLSTPTAQFMTGDLKDFYLGTPMDHYEYMRVPIRMIPPDIMLQYNLDPICHNGYVMVEIRRGMYGLPQAGKLANDQLIKRLAPHGYAPVPITPGLWRHCERNILFSLVVDDFGVKYCNKEDANHLHSTLNKYYSCSSDWTGERYCGLTLKWNYNARTCDISLPGYIERALQRFQHPAPQSPEDAPHPYVPPKYGAKIQYTEPCDTTTSMDANDTLHLQTVLGTLLFYARAVDLTMLTAIGDLATQQHKGTQTTMKNLVQLLNYCASHPSATVRYTSSDMILAVESDASYLSVPKARSRAAGIFFLTNPASTNDQPLQSNGPIHVLCQTMREVLSSAAEAELGALFHNAKEACSLRITLEEMGHPQPPTPILTDNSTAVGIANDTIKQKRSKAIDMRFYWLRDRVRQGHFRIYWQKGSLNRADYMTKHHPASHHRAIRSVYLHSPDNPRRNYFECLTDTEEKIGDTRGENCVHPFPAASGEGVLISETTCPTPSATAGSTSSQSDERDSSPWIYYPSLAATRRQS